MSLGRDVYIGLIFPAFLRNCVCFQPSPHVEIIRNKTEQEVVFIPSSSKYK